MNRREYIKYRDEMSEGHYAATGVILGIIGFFGVASIICGILAIVFGAIQKKKWKTPFSTFSIVLGIVDIVLRLILFAVLTVILVKFLKR